MSRRLFTAENKPRYSIILEHQRDSLMKYDPMQCITQLQTMASPDSIPHPDPHSLVVFVYSEILRVPSTVSCNAHGARRTTCLRSVWFGGRSPRNKVWFDHQTCCAFGGLIKATHAAIDELLETFRLDPAFNHVVLVTDSRILATCFTLRRSRVSPVMAERGVGLRHILELERLNARVGEEWFEQWGIEFSVYLASTEHVFGAREYAQAEVGERLQTNIR